MRRAGVLALIVGLAAMLPGTALAAGDSLQLVGAPQIDKAGSVLADSWVVSGSGASFDQPGYRADFSWSVPATIPSTGADVTLTVQATDKSGGGLTAGLGLHGNVPFTGGDGTVHASANLISGPPVASTTKTFRLVPGSYCDTCAITVWIGLQGGPRITFSYKVVPKPTGRPCRAGAAARTAQAGCLVGEPAPGRAKTISSPALGTRTTRVTVDVSGSAGGLAGTTIVGAGEARKERADRIGEGVAACYLIGTDAFDYSAAELDEAVRAALGAGEITLADARNFDRPATRLKICIALARALLEESSVRARTAGSTCRAKRIVLAPRVRAGRIVGLKRARTQRSSRSSVRYGCTATGSGARLTVSRAQGLRAAVGARLGLGFVRAPAAPASGATLSVRFR